MKKKKVSQDDAVGHLVEMIRQASAGKKHSATREDIKDNFDFTLLEDVYKSFQKKGNEKAFFKVLGITPKRWGTIFSLLKYYKAIFSPPSPRADDTNFYQFTHLLGRFIDFRVSSPPKPAPSFLQIQFLNPPLECLKGDLLFFHTKGELPVQEMQRFVNIIESMPQEHSRKVAYILSYNHTQELVALAKESRYKFVVLSSPALKDLVLASNPQVELNVITTLQLDLLDIQPYRTHGSTPSMMFFGRKREIDWFLNDSGISFAIYGGRQLGKTSLLRKIQEILDENRQEKTCFITCEGIEDNLSLGLEILKQLDVDSSSIHDIHQFEECFRDYLRTQKVHHTIFIDEVDDLVDIDRKSKQKIFVALRNIYNDFRQKCRFFFAGFKKLYSEFYRLYAPFRNFAEPYELKSLTKRDAQRLIREPLCNRLGVKFLSENSIVQKIYQYTAGHPCFIQHYCKCLIERIAAEERRIVTKEDVEEVYQSEAYRNLIIGTYSDNFREGEVDGDVLPKLIICHVIFEELEVFTQDELTKSLKGIGVEIEPFVLRSELRKLTMTSVLEKHQNLYRFTNSVYPKILRESENLTDILIQLAEKSRVFLEKQSKTQTSKETNGQFVLHAEADRIIKDSERSYAVIAGNGYGKTTLVETLEKIYRSDLACKSLHLSCQEAESIDHLVKKAMHHFGMPAGDDKREILKEFIADENQHGRRVIILLDHLDFLINKDKKRVLKMLAVFEELSQEFEEGFRVILTGGVHLYSTITSSCLKKSVEILCLHPLDERAARQLIRRSIKKQGRLHFEDETLIDMVLEYTSGNPSLITYFTHLLHEKFAEGVIEEQTVEQIGLSDDFRNFVLDTYEEGWEDTHHNIVSAIIDFDKQRFTIEDIVNYSVCDETTVQQLFSQLSLIFFLKRTGKSYRFSNPYYKDCYQWRAHL